MITFIESFIHELKHERIGTEKILALCPADKADYKPHRKSMSLKDLATHLADIPTWISGALTTDEHDFGINPYNPKACSTGEEYISYFNENVDKAIRDLEAAKDEILLENWTLRNGAEIYMTLTRLETILREWLDSGNFQKKLAVIQYAYGRIPNEAAAEDRDIRIVVNWGNTVSSHVDYLASQDPSGIIDVN